MSDDKRAEHAKRRATLAKKLATIDGRFQLTTYRWPEEVVVTQVTPGVFKANIPGVGSIAADSEEKFLEKAERLVAKEARRNGVGATPIYVGPEHAHPDQPATGRGKVGVKRGAAGSEYLAKER